MNPLEAVARYGSQSKAADALGIGRTKFRESYKLAAFQQNGADCHRAVGTAYDPPKLNNIGANIGGLTKPRLSVRADMPTTRVLAIGDTHCNSLIDNERFKWIARHAAKTRPDQIVHIGDLGDWHSCSRHEAPGTLGYARKPTFVEDLGACEEALTFVYKEIGSDIPLHLTAGNHDAWLQLFEEANPAMEGGVYQQFLDMMARFGWRVTDYGEFHFIDSCAFVHIPKNILGKPYGGRNIENSIGNDATFSIVCGHSHRAIFKSVPKIGPAQSIEVLNLGSAMKSGYVAPYAKLATTGWTYGIFDIEIRCGHIVAHSFVPMENLQQMYGD